MMQGSVLVVEDDLTLREALCDTLELAGYPVISAADGLDAIDMLAQQDISVVVSDVQMKPMDGHSLLKKLKSQWPDLPVVLMTAYGTIQKAVEAMQDGAVDYLVKPFEAEVLVSMVSRYISYNNTDDNQDLIAVDDQTKNLAALARRVAASDATVLITGESGSGKEVFAQYIHKQSRRAEGPFVAINCAAIPDNMLEAVIFGYEKGAFTGAYNANPGKFEQANGGTILLDEISEMNMGLQAKMLRVLQEREVERLGGRKLIPLDVRVLATSNRNLRDEVVSGRFREDLFYRLNVFPLHLAPLSARPLDILPLVNMMIEKWCQSGMPRPILAESAQEKLLSYDWPGNVRELDNVIQRSLILMSGNKIDAEHIVFENTSGHTLHHNTMDKVQVKTDGLDASGMDSLGEDLKSRETGLILEVLKSVKGSRKDAAEKLGISPRTLRYKLARLRDEGVELQA